MRTTLASAALLLAVTGLSVRSAESPTFKIVDGAANGSRDILERRKAEVTEKKGGKLSGHDWWLWGLTGIDYDKDGDTDLIVTIHGPTGHGVFLKNNFKETGQLTLTNVTKELGVDWLLPSAEGRRSFVWDFNGDGWPDFSGLHSPDFINQQGKSFTTTKVSKESFGTFSPQAIIDINGDGHPDVYNASGFNGVWNPEKQKFDITPFTHPLLEKMPDSVKALWGEEAKKKQQNRFLRLAVHTDHDLDGDGVNEVIVTGYGSYGGDSFGRYLATNENRTFTDRTKALGLPETGTPILIRDLDGDGFVDVLVAASPEGGFYRNTGKDGFTLVPGPLTEHLKNRDPYLHRADVADFNRDGLPDLVVSKPRSGPKIIYANRGDGKFEELHRIKGWDADPVVVCDLNDDGLQDVAVGGDENQVTLFVNTTAKPGNGVLLYPKLPAPNPFAVGAKVEVFRAGSKRPFLVENAHADGTPIGIGLGDATTFDLRVTFQGKAPIDVKGVKAEVKGAKAADRMQFDGDGKITILK